MEPHVVYSCHTEQPALSLERDATGAEDGLLWRKQLIYTGNFVKGAQRFAVDRPLLQHWRNEFNRFKQNGISVPLPIGHWDNPENNRGELLELEIADQPDGRSALYGVLKFRDKEAAKMAASTDVSVFVPPEFVDGKGQKYTRPIQHVALTNYPVIPGLEKFQPIVASFELDPQKGIAMSLQTLAEKLSIPFADKDDATVEAEIFTKFQTLMAEVDKLKAKIVELGGEVDGAAPAAEAEAVAAAFNNPTMVGLLRDNRLAKLNDLLRDGKATPAQVDAVKKRYLTDGALSLALSHTVAGTTPVNDGFDAAVETLSLGRAVKLGEQTAQQSNRDVVDPKTNILLRDAQRRKEAAAAAKHR